MEDIDSHPLTQATQQFPWSVQAKPDPRHELVRISVTDAENKATQHCLVDLIAWHVRRNPDMTIWLDVVCQKSPDFILTAIEACIGLSPCLVVTHQGASTHRPGHLLSDELRLAVSKVCGAGSLWHPLENQVVKAFPSEL